MNGIERRRQALAMAERITCADRNTTYGDAEDNFKDIAAAWNDELRTKLLDRLTAADVAALMILMKLVRRRNDPQHWDSILDILGYATCLAGIGLKEQQECQSSKTKSSADPSPSKEIPHTYDAPGKTATSQ